MTDQMKAFCQAYCRHFDRIQAYIDAGYVVTSRTNAARGAATLFAKQVVCDYIDGILRDRRNDTVNIDVDALIKELLAIAFTRIDDVVDCNTGEILQNPKGDSLAAVSEFTVDEFETETVSKRKRRVKLHSKLNAIETLLRVSGATGELAQALRVLSQYGIDLKQDENGVWHIKR